MSIDMDRWGWPAIFGLACLTVLALSWFTRRHQRNAHTVDMSFALIAAWSWSKIIAAMFGWDGARALYPEADIATMVLVMRLWRAEPGLWKLAIGFVQLTKLIVHVDFRFWSGGGTDALYLYGLRLNILFGIAICYTALPSGIAIWRLVRAPVSGGRNSHHGALPAPGAPRKVRRPF